MVDRAETPAEESGRAGDRLEGGTYEVVRARLLEQGRALSQKAQELNRQRLELFGGSELRMVASERIRTENNCVPRDIVAVGGQLLFGYNVFIGLRKETRVEDVLCLHRFAVDGADDLHFTPAPGSTFLDDPGFRRDFHELFEYYKAASLVRLECHEGRLLAALSTGDGENDLKVFRFAVERDGGVSYIDNRGERDISRPPSHDFEWTATSRDDHVDGRHPHVSILDEVFVETLGGTLTIKIEDNTEDGEGIYSEPVEDPNQSLEDAEIRFASVGAHVLLCIRPYRESGARYLVFNRSTRRVQRIDAIGHACIQLPDDHGIIYPGGYTLSSGDSKHFDGDVEGMEFTRRIRSPNGEDVLFVFHEMRSGRYILLLYNTIRKEVQSPIHCHGYSMFADGRMIVFRDRTGEPTRVHTMQIWETPFTSEEVAARRPSSGSHLETIGNPDLVRGISDSFSLARALEQQEPGRAAYEALIAAATRMTDQYHWLSHEEVGDLGASLAAILETSEVAIGEFEKFEALRAEADLALRTFEQGVEALFATLRPEQWETVDAYVRALADLRRKRGELIGLRERRYVDLARIEGIEARIVDAFEGLSSKALEYLLEPGAFASYAARIEELLGRVESEGSVAGIRPLLEGLDGTGLELDVLTEVLGTLEIDDATKRTDILERISEVYGQLNRAKAIVGARRKDLLGTEGRAEFAAEFKLFGQAVTSAITLADTPEKCDEQLGRLLVQIEELESRFGEFDDFLDELTTRREDVYEAFGSRKQALVDEKQRRAEQTMRAAVRLLEGVTRRASALESGDGLNAYFASDPMVHKLRDQIEHLRDLSDSVRADELESRLKSAREEAVRSLRDRRDIYEDGASVILLGRHRFSVNRKPLDVTVIPRDGGMTLHLAGTDYYEPVEDETFEATRPYWDQRFVSENRETYRGEYLAAQILAVAESGEDELSLPVLRRAAHEDGALGDLVRRFAADRYDEGYERGLHDADATLILGKLIELVSTAKLLRFAPRPRAWASWFWARLEDRGRKPLLALRAQSLGRLREAFGARAHEGFAAELSRHMDAFFEQVGVEAPQDERHEAARYLFEELAGDPRKFVASADAENLLRAFRERLEATGEKRAFTDDVRALEGEDAPRYELARSWLEGFVESSDDAQVALLRHSVEEAAVWLVTERQLTRRTDGAPVRSRVDGLLGQHPRIASAALELRLDEFLARLDRFHRTSVPGFRDYQAERGRMLERARERLRLTEFKPRVMSSFVRNELIDRVYLPLIGDNLAKQMGALGDGKRTDNMGLLLLISPPGYGKTTLMEYVADRLGLVFMKVNGPALGHDVTSLDPEAAPNAAARQEVEKINLAFEMGNNVLLYLDDIQHTSSELLQKFISLCDGQRRVEGVWRGRTRTYDLRGKRFAVCMAGNPYTESGEKFRVPDMLANRADIYNLGDVLSGREDLFAQSFIENALTSNPVLAALTTHEQADVAKLVRMARGESVRPDELSFACSSVELEEILSILRKLLRVQEVLLAVNAEYIRSASMDDAFRTEPSFKLQGSYRNMNKLAEKLVPVMNEDELESLIEDHYQGEAQTLTTGAEHNLLKLAELRGRMSEAQRTRWEQIVRDFRRAKSLGGDEDDPVVRVTSQLALVGDRLEDIGGAVRAAAERREAGPGADSLGEIVAPLLDRLGESLARLREAPSEAAGPGVGAELVAAMGDRLSDVSQRLLEIGDSIQVAAGAVGDAGSGDELRALTRLADGVEALAVTARTDLAPATGADAGMAPYLERLDATLQAVASAPRGGEVIQALGPGVRDLIEKMVVSIGDTLLPLLRGIEKRARLGEDDHRLRAQMNRTLKNFDMLKDLLEALKKIDTRDLIRRTRRAGALTARDGNRE